ncbi:terpene synthase family protein [Streptomyces sp. NPDC055239]
MEEAVLAGCVLMYLFELDGDLVEVPAGAGDASAAVGQLLRWEAVLAPHREEAAPLRDTASQALLGLWQQIAGVSGCEHQARLRLAWRTYALGAAAEAAFMSASTLPSPEEYSVLRAHTIADWPLVWIGITAGYVLPEDLWHSPAISRINQLAQQLLGISNDIWSYEREHAASTTAVNYPVVLAQHYQCPLARGLEMTVALHRKVMDQFLRMHEQLSCADSSLVRRYADDVAALVAGWHHWCERTSRY